MNEAGGKSFDLAPSLLGLKGAPSSRTPCLLYPCAASSYLRVLLHMISIYFPTCCLELLICLCLSCLIITLYISLASDAYICSSCQTTAYFNFIMCVLTVLLWLLCSSCIYIYIIEIQSFLYFPCPFDTYILAINP